MEYGFKEGGQEHNSEGRLITAEFDTFYLVTTYVPNAGRGLVTLDKRMDWDPRYTETNKDCNALHISLQVEGTCESSG